MQSRQEEGVLRKDRSRNRFGGESKTHQRSKPEKQPAILATPAPRNKSNVRSAPSQPSFAPKINKNTHKLLEHRKSRLEAQKI